MFDFLKTPIGIKLFCISGSLIIVITSLITALLFHGKDSERYSLLNHFISELGEVEVSHSARLFNLGLLVGGVLILPGIVGLGLYIPGLWSKLGMLFGASAAISVALVGVFPMNNQIPHTRAAITFFRTGLVMLIFFTVAIAFPTRTPPAISRWICLVSLPGICSYAAFLIYARILYQPSPEGVLTIQQDSRPRTMLLAVFEWLIFITTIMWFFVIATGL